MSVPILRKKFEMKANGGNLLLFEKVAHLPFAVK